MRIVSMVGALVLVFQSGANILLKNVGFIAPIDSKGEIPACPTMNLALPRTQEVLG